MINFDLLKILLENTIVEKQKQGYDVTSFYKEIVNLNNSLDALMALEYRVRHALYREDWIYVEPDGIDDIMAVCDVNRQKVTRLTLSMEAVKRKIRTGFTASICACMLGKPLEEAPYGTLWDIRDAAKAVGEWPIKNYVTEEFLTSWGRRNPSWVETTRGRIRHVAPDDDITYTLCGMLLLEKKGCNFDYKDIAKLWVENLPINTCWGPERTMLLRTGIQSLVPAHLPDYSEWVDSFNPGQEYCGAVIRADAYGYACPGNPELAVKLAWKDASFTHKKTGVYASMFIAAVIALAFEVSTPLEAIESALQFVPQESRFYFQMKEALGIVRDAASFDDAYHELHRKFNEYGACRIIQELGTVMNTLRFASDIEAGIGLQVAQGNDTDSFGCICGAILGVFYGQELPRQWTEPLQNTLHTTMGNFHETDLSVVIERMASLPQTIEVDKEW